MATATFGAGCFWGVEERFRTLEGVSNTEVGYMGGHVENPTYKQVCAKDTGHAEVVQLQFYPAIVSYEKLLELFFSSHNPTQRNRQGPDVGEQYRSVVFYHDDEQRNAAHTMKAALQNTDAFRDREIVTQIEEAGTFWRAEEYHQQYLLKQGRTSCSI